MSRNYKFHNPEGVLDDIIVFGKDGYEKRDKIVWHRG